MAHAGSLSAAAATGDLVQIHTHMSSGGFIDERDTHLNTPLHHACLAGNRAAVELLLSYGADVNAENMQGKSTLQFAGHSGDTVILRRLLEAGADANHQSHDGKTALALIDRERFPRRRAHSHRGRLRRRPAGKRRQHAAAQGRAEGFSCLCSTAAFLRRESVGAQRCWQDPHRHCSRRQSSRRSRRLAQSSIAALALVLLRL
jgi:hypothetical protein